jgi:PadR family transcriptional regulator, regulatory protein AphA
MSTERLTPTSYLVLGLLAREGPSTPYRLERMVEATLGNFWSFPHTLVYSEPSRLAALGLLTETRESEGRRRRIFTITQAGLEALDAWLRQPVHTPPELRDLGLLQLFFMDLAPDEARLRLAEKQLAMHQALLSGYEEDARIERGGRLIGTGSRTVEHWRGATLPMGLLYERAAVAFWAEVARDAAGRKEAEVTEGPSAGGPSRRRASAMRR